MQELIKIRKAEQLGSAVSAKDLYLSLGYNSTHWKRWYEKNIINNDFAIPNQDYIPFATRANGNDVQDFTLTIDFAKRLCMLAKTEVGERIRNYFIECEKQIVKYDTPKSFAHALRLAAEQQETIEQQAQIIEAQAPAVDFYKAVTGSEDALPIGDVAKILNLGFGRNELFKALRAKHILTLKNIPYQEFIDRGYFRVVEQKFSTPDGATHITTKTLVYQKGIEYIKKICQNI